MTTEFLHIAAYAIGTLVTVGFCAVILSAIFARKADNNGLIMTDEMHNPRKFTATGWH